MPSITVQPVTTRRQQKEFFAIAEKIYANNFYWVPPLLATAEGLLGFKPDPFYARNKIQTFLAYKDGEVAGRIAAIVNQGHLDRYNDKTGFWGFFECINDHDVAHALFDTARAWLGEQGLTRMRGPCNPSLNHELGLLIEGYNSSPMFMMTYNLPYYQKLVERYGFQKCQDLYAYWGDVTMQPDVADKYLDACNRIQERLNIVIRPMDKNNFLEEVKEFLRIYNTSMTNTWGFVPMTEEEVNQQARGLKMLLVPELTLAAEIDGKLVGCTLVLPDYNPRIRKIRGRLFPFGWFHLLHNKRSIKSIRLISTNVCPEYQLQGVGLVLLNGLVPIIRKYGICETEFSWVLESNHYSRGSLEKGGAMKVKTYRLYDIE